MNTKIKLGGTQVVILECSLSRIADGSLALPLEKSRKERVDFFKEKILPRVQEVQTAYGFFSMIYNSIPFEDIKKEMSEEDKEDLAPLFETKEMVKRLGSALLNIFILARKNAYKGIKNNPEYLKNYKTIQEFLSHTNDYRNKIMELGSRLKLA